MINMGEKYLPPPLFLPQLTRFDDTIKVAFKPLIIKFIIPYVFYTFKLYS